MSSAHGNSRNNAPQIKWNGDLRVASYIMRKHFDWSGKQRVRCLNNMYADYLRDECHMPNGIDESTYDRVDAHWRDRVRDKYASLWVGIVNGPRNKEERLRFDIIEALVKKSQGELGLPARRETPNAIGEQGDWEKEVQEWESDIEDDGGSLTSGNTSEELDTMSTEEKLKRYGDLQFAATGVRTSRDSADGGRDQRGGQSPSTS